MTEDTFWNNRERVKLNQLSAIKMGRGVPLLLLHGVGLRAEAWNGQIDQLSEFCALTAPDMPGHGESPMSNNLNKLADYTDMVASEIHQPTFVAGHSMGAMIALDLAVRYPDKILGVIALNAIYKRSPEAIKAVIERANSLDETQTPDAEPPLNRWFGSELSPARNACEKWLTSVTPMGYKSAYHVFAQTNGLSQNDLSSIHCHCLFITGQDELNSTPNMSQMMASLVAKGDYAIIDKAAHMAPMTHYKEVSHHMKNFILGHFRKE